ncbi:LAETG motif-containing sortase-dependent surface protein [Streptomyces sp. NPDC058301]|uniref:LAETG motif-containing sortase-dependent surface protein n=1 Tax=Streptomyces sp. NPDC058301 TaxID=3346436 RepID=UPI0036EF9304
MNIRRALATAVAAAVTAPVVILSAGPALADTKPAAQAQTQKKPTVEELEKAAAAAKKAYEDAQAKEKAARKVLDDLDSPANPLRAAYVAADKAADKATADKAVADKALTDAQFELEKLPADATPEDRDAKKKAVDEAKKAADKAALDQTRAKADLKAAADALGDARVKAAQEIDKAQQEVAKALAAKEAADKALADAKKEAEDPTCDYTAKLTTVATGLPSKIVAGTTTDFSLRVANGTGRTLDKVWPFTYLHATDKSGYKVTDDLLHLQWSMGASGGWKDLDKVHRTGVITNLRDGGHVDVKLRLKVDAKAPAGPGLAFVAGDYKNADGSCGGSPDLTEYGFEILAAGAKPGQVDPAKPGKGKANTPDNKPQGTTSSTPLNPTTGTLAATGSSSATPKLALAGGAAVVAGAGALLAVRRRRTDG